ncbi:HD domain-containing protein [Kallotenue papyrolyticum]|uniref:HD domain-containing protein n=1 Tax=Kallotenue papyrolyticum TaxID=1325125 RepID=UPI0004786507|nr:HD domain-containing protein [Kallotenue papyrolyticum]
MASWSAAERLDQQLRFIVELDRLKQVLRMMPLISDQRRENSAEHSWHLAVMALILAEYAPSEADLPRAVQMVLIHDLVEIDAGDTFCYDAQGNLDKAAREQRAAERLFGLLPPEQGAALRGLWEEFEAGATPTARFAVALDRLQPLLLNIHNRGGSWRAHRITRAQVLQRMQPIQHGLPALWPRVLELIAQACARGDVLDQPDSTG